jgi:hypothetical protein
VCASAARPQCASHATLAGSAKARAVVFRQCFIAVLPHATVVRAPSNIPPVAQWTVLAEHNSRLLRPHACHSQTQRRLPWAVTCQDTHSHTYPHERPNMYCHPGCTGAALALDQLSQLANCSTCSTRRTRPTSSTCLTPSTRSGQYRQQTRRGTVASGHTQTHSMHSHSVTKHRHSCHQCYPWQQWPLKDTATHSRMLFKHWHSRNYYCPERQWPLKTHRHTLPNCVQVPALSPPLLP